MLDPVRKEILDKLLTMPFGELVNMYLLAKTENADDAILRCIQAAVKHRCYKTLAEICGIDLEGASGNEKD